MTSTKQMLLPILMVSLFNLVTSAGDEYLPPVKGYNYDRPKIPFPTINQVNRQQLNYKLDKFRKLGKL
ncbi:unnamed protein product [Leptidea sinapis]|uniref:Uncharacterized protein n=1 Tax=Leptidea sinapis TaxID=189913 RepID=A0A5E4QTJ3_9NEOP|nr:unnamed protein product [Leptidea sinapis]